MRGFKERMGRQRKEETKRKRGKVYEISLGISFSLDKFFRVHRCLPLWAKTSETLKISKKRQVKKKSRLIAVVLCTPHHQFFNLSSGIVIALRFQRWKTSWYFWEILNVQEHYAQSLPKNRGVLSHWDINSVIPEGPFIASSMYFFHMGFIS